MGFTVCLAMCGKLSAFALSIIYSCLHVQVTHSGEGVVLKTFVVLNFCGLC